MFAPGCQLNACRPRNYGQVFFGEDNCLHDASGNRVENECCGTPDSAHSGPILNAWRDPRPAGLFQSTPGLGFVHFEFKLRAGSPMAAQVSGNKLQDVVRSLAKGSAQIKMSRLTDRMRTLGSTSLNT